YGDGLCPSSAAGTGTSGPYSATSAALSTAYSSAARPAIWSRRSRWLSRAICAPCAPSTTLSSSSASSRIVARTALSSASRARLACSADWRSESAMPLDRSMAVSAIRAPRRAAAAADERPLAGPALGGGGGGRGGGPAGDGPQSPLHRPDLEPGLH